MSISAAAAATALAVGKVLIKDYWPARPTCELLITNKTDSTLVHDECYPEKGTMFSPTSVDLPPIPPSVQLHDNEYPGESTIEFPQVVGMYIPPADLGPYIAPTVVMQWKFANTPLWLLVFVFMAGFRQTNCGFFQLRTEEVKDLAEWYRVHSGKDGKGKTWFEAGDFKNLTKTVRGVIVSGALDNEKNAKFTIELNGKFE